MDVHWAGFKGSNLDGFTFKTVLVRDLVTTVLLGVGGSSKVDVALLRMGQTS